MFFGQNRPTRVCICSGCFRDDIRQRSARFSPDIEVTEVTVCSRSMKSVTQILQLTPLAFGLHYCAKVRKNVHDVGAIESSKLLILRFG
jgi:hypothetical protein